jgi:hypothetical protein
MVLSLSAEQDVPALEVGAEAVTLDGDVPENEPLGQALDLVLDGHEPADDGGDGV